MGRRLVLAEQRSLFDLVEETVQVVLPALPQLRPYANPGPLPDGAGKMAGKSARKVASTRTYHRAFQARAPEIQLENRTSPTARDGDVTVHGPHRYYLAPLPGDADRRQLVDRATGAVLDEGSWLNMWGLALRMNGVEVGHA